MTEVVLLGSGGWIPTSSRATCSALARDGEHALAIDAGTGIARLIEEPGLLRGIRRMDIVLTHFHLDHVVGLSYLPALTLAERPRLHGPGAFLFDTPTEEILARLVDPPLFAADLDAILADVDEIAGQDLTIGPFELRIRVQERHNGPTLALRLDDELTYCTDTAFDEGNGHFARGSRVLAHEAWYTEDAPREVDTHSSARQAAQVAGEAGVDRLALIHIRPGSDEGLLAEEARSVFAATVVGRDLLTLGEADSHTESEGAGHGR
jgi:ribonuclease BN (tRNA processing enzyme)